jgi:hypothetical protein
MTRLVDPILADLQAEHHEAVAQGSVWRRRLAWLRAIVALARAGAVHSLIVRPYEERRHVGRALFVTAVAFVVAAAILWVPFLWYWHLPVPLLAYLVPYAVPFALPASLICGIVFGLGQARQKLRAGVVTLALVASCASFYVMTVVVPVSSEAFRAAARQEYSKPYPLPTVRRLTPGEMRLRGAVASLMSITMFPGSAGRVRSEFHSRLALACSSLVLAVSVLSMTRGRRWPDAGIAVAVMLGYFVSLPWADFIYESPVARAWVPNAICLVLATGSALLRWERARHQVVNQ